MSKKLRIPGPGDEGDSDNADNPGDPSAGSSGHDSPRELGWDFLFDFRAMAGELEEREGVEEVHWEMNDPVPEFTITTLEHGLGASIPERIKRFYLLTDGLKLTWRMRDSEAGDSEAGGGVEIFDFGTAFGPWLDDLWPTDPDLPESEARQDFLWSLRGFDRVPGPANAPDAPDASSPMVVMCVEEEYPSYDLFLFDPASRDTFLLELDFRGYLHALLETRATHGWQLLALEDPEAAFEAHPTWRPRAERARRHIERLFPEAELPTRKT